MAEAVSSTVSTVQYQLVTPEPFNFREPSEWPRWIRKFERFRLASGLDSKSGENQVNMLLYCLGDEGEDLLTSFGLKDEELQSYDTVKGRFESYLGFKINIVYERAKFLKRRQSEGEPVDSFINSLHKLAERCKLGELKDELIRDLIVIGVNDDKLSQNLQLDEKLTLSTAILKARQAESLKQQQKVVRESPEIEFVNKGIKQSTKHRFRDSSCNKSQDQSFSMKGKCNKCGFVGHHNNNDCPANQSTCFRCGIKGHYVRCCTKGFEVREINNSNEPLEKPKTYLGELTIEEVGGQNPCKVKLNVKGHDIYFKLDTGADVSIIGYDLCKELKLETNHLCIEIFITDRDALCSDRKGGTGTDLGM
ncbi:uncharacterized protein LOC129004762 [Macrosteles quadrilineatus]|uniref:uncharacterized protein LOC129004762 n=1 Tax=Macrosteles quadrilineatus TaxID=74068 RepID=UPI0023E2C9F2|nr:uncharacterized protein LOC129004762 [Macrosteles quadrilineatus]